MYNWRILLGGAASAAVLTVGVAAPAFAQSASRADTPVSSLGGVSQNLGSSGASEALGNLPDNNSISNDLGQGNSSQGS